MTNNPLLHYKPGLTMDAPIDVTMAAADWAILMAWFSGLPDDMENGVKHIIYGVIAEQISDALFTQASLQGAKAHYHEHASQQPGVMIYGGGQMPWIRAEDAEAPRCAACQRIAGAPTAPCLLCPDYGV